MDTLNEAIAKEKDVNGLILHSDQGFQYTSYEYKAICESNGIQISMSRKGTPIDDSPIESWHALLKKERIYSTCRRMDIILQYYKTKVKNQEKEKNLHKKRKITFLFLIYCFFICVS